jgi:4-amino-4-deoxy-L-arabinose transferase-like glycosyltransferase
MAPQMEKDTKKMNVEKAGKGTRKDMVFKNIISKIQHNKKICIILLVLFILSLSIHLLILANTDNSFYYSGLAVCHGEMARNIVEGRGFVINEEFVHTIQEIQHNNRKLIDIQDFAPPEKEEFKQDFYFPPGRGILLAATYFIFGQYRYIYLQVIQAIIDSFGVFLIFLIGKSLFDKRIGLISAFLFALNIPVARLAVSAIADSLIPFMMLLSLYFFIKAATKGSMKDYALTGIVIGLSTYLYPTILYLPIFFGLALFIYNHRKSVTLLKSIKIVSIIIICTFLIVAPWMIYISSNTTTKTPLSTTSAGGMWCGVWEGFGEFKNPVGAVCNDTNVSEIVQKEFGYSDYHTLEANAFFKEKCIATIKEHPIWWVSIIIKRIPRTTFFVGHDLFKILGIHSPQSEVSFTEFRQNGGTFIQFLIQHPYDSFVKASGFMFSFVTFSLAMIGVWIKRREWEKSILLLALPMYFIMVYIFTHIEPRFTLYGSSIYLILGAIALEWICIKAKQFMKRKENILE